METLKCEMVYKNQEQLRGDRHSKAIQTLSPPICMLHVFFSGFPVYVIPDVTADNGEAL